MKKKCHKKEKVNNFFKSVLEHLCICSESVYMHILS
jgi:hypothetical protein